MAVDVTPGPIALVGSGEYLPVMLEVERHLIDGRPPRYVQIPTAAAPEGPAVLAKWTRLGAEQAERLGVEAVALVVHDRAEADDPAIAEQVRGAGLVYMSGGNPAHLAGILFGFLRGAARAAEKDWGVSIYGAVDRADAPWLSRLSLASRFRAWTLSRRRRLNPFHHSTTATWSDGTAASSASSRAASC